MNTKRNGALLAPSEPGRWRVLERALQVAHAGPMTALMMSIAISVALVVNSRIPLGLGVLATVGFIVARLASSKVWRTAAEAEASQAVELPSDAEMTDRAAKALLGRIAVARTELEEVLESGAETRRGDLLVRIRSVRELERAAVATLCRIEYLSGAPKQNERTGCPVGEQEEWGPETAPILERAAAARAERTDALSELKVRRQRELARLEYLTSCLEAIPATLMELEVLERDVMEGELPDPVRDADVFRDEVRQVRQEIGSVQDLDV